MYKISRKGFAYNNNIRRVVLGVLAVAAALASLIVLYKITGADSSSYDKKYIIDDGWTVEFDDKTYSGITLSSFKFPHGMNRGDRVTLYNKLPDNIEFRLPVLKMQTYSSAINVYCGGELIYSYGSDLFEKGAFVGNGYHYADISQAQGDTIKIELTATEYNSFSSVEDIVLTGYSNVFRQMIVGGRVPFAVSVFLILFGIVVTGISGWIIIKKPELSMLLWIGVLSLAIGTWTSCNYRFAQMFNVSLSTASTLEYASMLVGQIAALMYFMNYVRRTNSKMQQRVFMIFTGAVCVFSAAVFLLHITDVVHMPSVLPAIHAVIAAESVYIIYLIVLIIRSGSTSSKLLFIGFCVLICFVFFEIISYMLKIYADIYIMDRTGASAVGTMAFVVFMLLNFSVDMLHRLREANEKEIYYKMAHTDALTKLANRRYCERVMNELSQRDEQYGIYSFDLNDLKYINDNLGHGCGDDLIHGFAEILTETFQTDGVVGRMGGDEFIAIVSSGPDFNYKNFIAKMNDIMARENSREKRFQYKVSCGYADSSELPSSGGHVDSHEIYALADDRMYVCKRESKKKNREKRQQK